MPRRKLPYREGDWIAVPLHIGGYALGLVARSDGKGRILGYFFGPRWQGLPLTGEIPPYASDDAILVLRFGDMGLQDGKWVVLGQAGGWQREDWPLPCFGRVDEHAGKAWLVEYDDTTLSVLRETAVSPEEVRHLPRDAFSGAGAVEIALNASLNGSPETATRETMADADRDGDESTDGPESWGVGLFEDDVALDVKGDLEGAVAAGASAMAAADMILERMKPDLDDVDDGPIIVLALASLLLDHGVNSHQVLTKAEEIVRDSVGLERWEDAGEAELSQRRAVYAELATRLSQRQQSDLDGQ